MPHIEMLARGLWIRDGSALLCQNVAAEYWYLPGGHVEFGESASAALTREFREETGLSMLVGPPLLLIEQGFLQDGRARHEMTLVFHVEPADVDPEVSSLEDAIRFQWVPIPAVFDLDIRPEPIRAWLASGGRTGPMPTPAWISMMGSDG